MLRYLYDDTPSHGTTREVIPGVRWLQMPLPMALDHINLWAVRDGNGWAVVDTGAKTPEAVQALLEADSLGRHFNQVFKPQHYRYRRVE